MRKIKHSIEEYKYKDSGPNLYEMYFNNHTSINYGRNSIIRCLVKNTCSKDEVGKLVSNEDRLMVLIEDRIQSNQRKKF